MADGILRGDEGHKKGGGENTHTHQLHYQNNFERHTLSDNTISLPYSGVRKSIKSNMFTNFKTV